MKMNKRLISGGAAMVFLLLALSVLSIQLFLAQQRASRNAQLALNASAEILPLIALHPATRAGAGDPMVQEVHVSTAISYLETLRLDDPENLKCLTTLRALYGAFGSLLLDRNRVTEAQAAYQKAESMAIPIALNRLRAWKPAAMSNERSREALSFPNSYDRNRLQALLAIAEQGNATPSLKNALNYAELTAEYLLLLDTSMKPGRTEVRRVLDVSLKKFEDARVSEPLTSQHEELVTAMRRSLDRLSSDD
jgi:hypothetical protein